MSVTRVPFATWASDDWLSCLPILSGTNGGGWGDGGMGGSLMRKSWPVINGSILGHSCRVLFTEHERHTLSTYIALAEISGDVMLVYQASPHSGDK